MIRLALIVLADLCLQMGHCIIERLVIHKLNEHKQIGFHKY
jgi:hypothetical protein